MKANETNPEAEHDELQKALALKRHEQPPPRFFKSFSNEVIDRIHAPESEARGGWLERLGWGEDSRPYWLCGLGLAACAVLVLSLVAALRVEKRPAELEGQAADPSVVVTPSVAPAGDHTLSGYRSLTGEATNGGVLAPVMTPATGGGEARKP
jgi:hypothetical protein